MLFDQPCELPIATVRRAPGARLGLLVGNLRRWIGIKWSWVRPRTIPLVVAGASAFAVIEAINYLSPPPERPATSVHVPLISMDSASGQSDR